MVQEATRQFGKFLISGFKICFESLAWHCSRMPQPNNGPCDRMPMADNVEDEELEGADDGCHRSSRIPEVADIGT